jgi:drug/metabolite transporter (DMT)-like permease
MGKLLADTLKLFFGGIFRIIGFFVAVAGIAITFLTSFSPNGTQWAWLLLVAAGLFIAAFGSAVQGRSPR